MYPDPTITYYQGAELAFALVVGGTGASTFLEQIRPFGIGSFKMEANASHTPPALPTVAPLSVCFAKWNPVAWSHSGGSKLTRSRLPGRRHFAGRTKTAADHSGSVQSSHLGGRNAREPAGPSRKHDQSGPVIAVALLKERERYRVISAVAKSTFLKAHALALARSEDRKSSEVFCGLIAGVTEELKLHRVYAAELGIDLSSVVPNAACRAYTDFLLRTAWQTSLGETVASMTPCMRLYAT
jgi:hypothetical protein